MENEIMNFEDVEVMEDAVAANGKTGIGTGVAIAIGAGLALAVGAGVKMVKNAIANHKAKKAARELESAYAEETEEK